MYKKDYVEVEWDQEDALTFPLCLSAVTDDEHGGLPVRGPKPEQTRPRRIEVQGRAT